MAAGQTTRAWSNAAISLAALLLCWLAPAAPALDIGITLSLDMGGPGPSPVVTVSPDTSADPLLVSESGSVAVAVVQLNQDPGAAISIPLTSDVAGQVQVTDLAGTPLAAVAFSSADWSPRILVIRAVDDAVVDGDVAVTVQLGAIAGGGVFNGLDPADLRLSVLDDELPGLAVTAAGGTTVGEAGLTDTIAVALTGQPSANVAVAVAVDPQLNCSAASLTFTAANWSTPQVLTIGAVDDLVVNGSRSVLLTLVGTWPGGASATSTQVVAILDDERALVEVTPTSGLVTGETGSQAYAFVRLGSPPVADVTIAISSSDVGEGTVLPAALTFTAANWNSYQQLTLTGVADSMVDGNQAWTVLLAAAVSADAAYNGVDPSDIAVTTTDADVAGILSSPSFLVTSEAGGSATLDVRLRSKPGSDVHLAVAVAPGTEAGAGAVTELKPG